MKVKKTIAVFLCFVMVFCFACPAFAAGSAQPRWANISSIGGGVWDAETPGYHVVDADVVVYDSSQLVVLTANLQKYNSGWQNTGTSWTTSGHGVLEIYHELELAPGNYRVQIQVRVYTASGAYLEGTTVETGGHIV